MKGSGSMLTLTWADPQPNGLVRLLRETAEAERTGETGALPVAGDGTEPELDFDKGVVWFRRSHTLGKEVMRMTKNGLRFAVGFPPEAIDVIRWHIGTQLTTEEQKTSDLLFPTEEGGFRAPCVLNKPSPSCRGVRWAERRQDLFGDVHRDDRPRDKRRVTLCRSNCS
jgi:hypothetical protein